MSKFEVKDIDRAFYERELKEFLPKKMIDIHTHVHSLKYRIPVKIKRTVVWPSLVAPENTGEQIQEMYKLMLPDKEVTPLMFGSIRRGQDFKKNNDYVAEVSRKFNFPALYFSRPEETAEELEAACKEGNFLGLKSYLSLAPEFIPEKEIRIFDFFPKHQFEVADKNGWIIMLHIPRDKRFGDELNLAQLLEIDEDYPNAKVIVAHIGRAYAEENVGEAFEVLSKTKNLLFDFSANTNKSVIQKTIETFGPKRVLFGSDAPICKMRTRRIVENGNYINLVPKGLYGDESQDPHLRGVEGPEAENITYFLYEELYSFKKAAIELGLTKEDIEDIFYNNAKTLIDSVK